MKIYLQIALFSLLFSSSIVTSQNKSHIIWTTDSESLPQNSIKSIVSDKYGFIWMTTENGLVRYDGKDFKVYDSQNIGIKNNRLIYIRGNRQKDSLFTFNEDNDDLILINKRTAKKLNPALYKKSIPFIKGEYSTFLSHGIPSIFFDTPKRPYKILLPSNNYYQIANDKISLFDKNDKLLFCIPFKYETNEKFFTFGETLFYLENNGKYSIIKDGKIAYGLLDIPLNAQSELYWNIVSGQVFIYTKNKLYHIGYNSQNLTKCILIENENLKPYNVWSIYFDTKNSIIYLGSVKKGLGIYKIKPFTTITPGPSENPELYEVFYALTNFGKSNIISASGIVMDDNKIIDNFHFTSDKYDIAIDYNQDVWTSKGPKLFRYKKSNHYKNPEFWDLKYEISTVFTASDGKVWFDLKKNLGESGSLYYFEPSKNPIFIKFADTDFKINCFAQKDSQSIYIGTKKGLYRIDNSSKEIYKIKQTKDIKIRSIYISDQNNVWLTTYENGFFLYKDNHFYSFPEDKNHYLVSAHCIIEDKKGFFWISTNKGLFQASKKSLLDYAAKRSSRVYYHYYNKDFGFLSNEFNGGCQPCGTMAESGNIFFPSINGVVTFNPDLIHPVLPDNDIFVDEVIIDEKKYFIDDTLNLNRNFERIRFFITSPYFGNSNNMNFEAKLEGPENFEWTVVPKENNISYTKLRPGIYELTIRKLSGFDSKYIYKKITIVIEPAFWQTLWFTFFMLAITVLLIYLSYNFRLNYIQKRNIMLEKTINDQTLDLRNTISTLRATKDNLNQQIDNNNKVIQYITHDIKSPLKFMAMASQMMYDSYDKDHENMKENLKAIFTSSTQMFNFVDNLLEYSKVHLDDGMTETEEFKLYEVIKDKIALFFSIAESQKTHIINNTDKNSVLKTNRQLFSIIIHNILDNAVKNTHHGNIVLSSSIINGNTFITIKDSGRGMDPAILEHYQSMIKDYNLKQSKNNSNIGLQIVLELLLILNGKMAIESKENEGTTVTIIFQNNNY